MIIKIEKIDEIDVDVVFDEIILNKSITMKSKTNMYEVLFQSKCISKIFDTIINILKNETNEDFDVYIKTIWGYVQTTIDNRCIIIDKKLKDELSPKGKYSFIYCIKADNTLISLKDKNENVVDTQLKDGNLIIFKTDNFVKDESTSLDRVLLVGSLTNEIVRNIPKKIII